MTTGIIFLWRREVQLRKSFHSTIQRMEEMNWNPSSPWLLVAKETDEQMGADLHPFEFTSFHRDLMIIFAACPVWFLKVVFFFFSGEKTFQVFTTVEFADLILISLSYRQEAFYAADIFIDSVLRRLRTATWTNGPRASVLIDTSHVVNSSLLNVFLSFC